LKKRKILRSIVATVLAAAGFVAVGALPASAAYLCQDNQVCFYEGSYYTGTAFVPAEMASGGSGSVWNFQYRVFSNGTNANERVTSIVNNTGWCVAVYTRFGFYDDDGTESRAVIGPDKRVNLDGYRHNNRISSTKFLWGASGACP